MPGLACLADNFVRGVYNTMSDISKCGWTENEDDDAGFTEHYKAAEEYLLKYLPSSESKFTQTV